MSTQSYPWYKFAHVEYLIDPMINAMSLAAQGANTRLMAYAARQLPFGTLPNDEKTLLAMSGAKSLKQWQKLHTELMGSTWFVNDDNRWFCPLMNVDSMSVADKAKQAQEGESKKAMTNAERQAAYKARQAELALLAEQSNVTGNGEVTEGNGASNEKVTTGNAQVTDVSLLLGGKGGDLDLDLKQDLELNQEVKNSLSQNVREEKNKLSQNFFDDELKPNLKVLNDKFIGEIVVTQEMIDSQLFLFNAHYETQQLTDNQRLAKWVSWIKRKVVDEKIAETRAQKITVPSRRTPTPDNFAAKNYSAGINTDGSF